MYSSQTGRIITNIFVILTLFAACNAYAQVYQRLINRVPIFSEAVARQNISSVKDLKECSERCSSLGQFVYTIEKAKTCVCLDNSSIFEHGLIPQDNSVTYFIPNEFAVLHNFLYMDINHVRDATTLSACNVTKNVKLTVCALACLNYNQPGKRESTQCLAFSYDVIKKECVMYDKSHFVKMEDLSVAKTTQFGRRLYFEKLSNVTKLYAATWNAKAEGLKSITEMTDLRPKTASECAEMCYRHTDCYSLNYNPVHGICNGFSEGIAIKQFSKLRQDINSIYFEMIPSNECPSDPLVITSRNGYIRSPGWPHPISESWMNGKKECKWNVLTTWGSKIVFSAQTFHLGKYGECKASLTINGKTICDKFTDKGSVINTQGVENPLTLKVNDWETGVDKPRFLLNFRTSWLCEKNPPILSEPGEIASADYPHSYDAVPITCYWKLQPKTKMAVNIIIEDMNLIDEHNPPSKETKLQFTSGGKTTTCTGNSFTNICKQTMRFDDPVTVMYDVSPSMGNFRGFRLKYYFGKETNNFKSVNKTRTIELNKSNNKQSIEILASDYEQNAKTTLIYNIENTLPEGIVNLRINDIQLSDGDGLNDCPIDYLIVDDPEIKTVHFKFCGRKPQSQQFKSLGRQLTIVVRIQKLPFVEKKSRYVKFEVSSGLKAKTVEPEMILENTEIVSENYPGNYPANSRSSFVIQSTEDMEPTLKIEDLELAEFQYGGTSMCDNDRLVIQYNSKRATTCGHDKALMGKRMFTNKNGNMMIDFTSDDRYSARGFKISIDFIKVSRCESGKEIVVDGDDYLMSENYPDEQQSATSCRWRLRSNNATGIYLNLKEQCQELSYILPTNETRVVNCNGEGLHLPTDTVILWNANDNANKFLAQIEERDVSTTPIPTTTPETTVAPTTVKVTTVKTIETTTMGLKGPLDPGANRKEGDNAIFIGCGVGAFLLVAVIVVVVGLKLRRRRKDIDDAEKRFPTNTVYYDNELYKNPHEVNNERDYRFNIKSIAYEEDNDAYDDTYDDYRVQ